ncbi:RNA-dependent RNA polymerase [Colletotrichum liriopes partitivirus 1]|nr:RNA-dependent RNA polymerase [Colletotrichum liriopes partitivirus 1]
MPLKILRNVARFTARSERQHDTFAREALMATASARTLAFVTKVSQEWHRPSGDHALLEDSLSKYDCNLPKRCVSGDYLAILKKTLDELRPDERIIPLTTGASAKHPNFPTTTSPGFPWVTQGFATKGEVIGSAAAMGHIHRIWDSIGRGIPWSLPDSLTYQRVIASPAERTKVRPVWGYPVEVIVEEGRFFYPLIDALNKLCNDDDAFYGLGMETMRSGHSHLSRSFDPTSTRLSLSADLSNFDARVTDWIIRDVFALLSDWFDFTKVRDSEGKIWNVKPEQTCRRWKAMVSYFINTKVRTPTGKRFQKSAGVPSGSMFTNVMDTIVNAVQMRTCIRRVTGHLPAKDYYFGDDSQMFLDTDINLDALAKELLLTFGAILSVEKTILSDNPDNIHWLGYFHRSTGPRRDLAFIVASTLYPERPVDAPIESCARMLGQLYSVMDPKAAVIFYDAVRWLQQKYSISTVDLDKYVESLSPRALRYLVTLGMAQSEVKLPDCFTDPFGGRYIPAVLPRPSPRKFRSRRDRNLPDYAFIPEAYSNPHLRQDGFHDFNIFTEINPSCDLEFERSYFSD